MDVYKVGHTPSELIGATVETNFLPLSKKLSLDIWIINKKKIIIIFLIYFLKSQAN